jgi:COP9 signalosome complex subunit 3
LNYHVSLNYHYAGAICFAALKRFREAEDFFEIVVSSPAAHTPSALQLDALNKLSLIQLMTYGKVGYLSPIFYVG